jgi:quercetin dioxygenase-like cupin family protein
MRFDSRAATAIGAAMSDVTASPRRFVSASETEPQHLEKQVNQWYFKDGLGDSKSLVFVRARFTPGGSHPFHSHPEMDEIIYLLSGEMEQWVEKEKRVLRPGDSAYIPRGVVHGCYNDSGADCEFLAILTPSKIQGPFSVDHSQEAPWRVLR